MIKLNKKEIYPFIILILLYCLALQYNIDSIFQTNEDFIEQGNLFENIEAFKFFLKMIIIFITGLYLVFQAFIYRLILLLLRANVYPTISKNVYFLLISLIPYSLLIIAIETFQLNLDFDSTLVYVFRLITTVAIYVTTLYLNDIIKKNKLIPITLVFILIEVLFNIQKFLN